MSQQEWIDVDSYITDLLVKLDAALDAALKASDAVRYRRRFWHTNGDNTSG